METQPHRVRDQPIGLVEGRFRLVRRSARRKYSPKRAWGGRGPATNCPVISSSSPNCFGSLQRLEYPAGVLGGLCVLLVEDGHLGQTPLGRTSTGDFSRFFSARVASTFSIDGDDAPEHVFPVDVFGQVDQVGGVDRLRIEFGQLEQAIPLGRALELVGQQDDLACRGLGAGVIAQRARSV